MTLSHLFSGLVGYFKQNLSGQDMSKPEQGLERIPFEFIADKLYEAAYSSKDVIGRKVVAPDKYIIRFSPEDRALLKNWHIISITVLRN